MDIQYLHMTHTSDSEPSLRIETSTVSDGNFSLKFGNEAAITRNREQFLTKHGLRLEDCVVMELEHGDTIRTVDYTHSLKNIPFIKAEALVTKERGLVLFLMTADCLPVVLYDPINKVIALAHLGRRPTTKHLLPKVVHTLNQEFSTDPASLVVSIGPGIHKESYVFTPPLEETAEAWQPFIEKLPSGEVAVDVVGYNRAQLEECGVLATNIHVKDIDTATHPEYFSHYRSLRTGESEGRFATLAWLQ